MTPGGQKRVLSRMDNWATLSPAQRKPARENSRRISMGPPAKRGALKEQGSEYQSLPPHERRAPAAR
jgi:hypothetical protein